MAAATADRAISSDRWLAVSWAVESSLMVVAMGLVLVLAESLAVLLVVCWAVEVSLMDSLADMVVPEDIALEAVLEVFLEVF